jgi:hypothetical protein
VSNPQNLEIMTDFMTETKIKGAEEKRAEMLKAIETMKTAASFINHVNQHTAEKYIAMIGMLNRVIKSELTYTTLILDEEEKESHLHADCGRRQAMELIHSLAQQY